MPEKPKLFLEVKSKKVRAKKVSKRVKGLPAVQHHVFTFVLVAFPYFLEWPSVKPKSHNTYANRIT